VSPWANDSARWIEAAIDDIEGPLAEVTRRAGETETGPPPH